MVVGLGRSGTSTITRALQALGVDLGERLVGHLNAKGSFEDYGFSRVINRRVLEAFGYSWRNWQLNDVSRIDYQKLTMLYQAAFQLVSARFRKTDHFAFKAVSTSKMIPFWQDVCSGLGYQDHYVIALRNPLAVALSYQKIDGTPIEVSLLQWIMHLIPVIEHTTNASRIVVAFDALMNTPHEQMKRLRAALHIKTDASSEAEQVFINSFLDKTLKHHELSIEDLIQHKAVRVAPICVPLYKLLLQLSQDQITFESEAFQCQWKKIKDEFLNCQAYYGYFDELLQKQKSLERHLRFAKKFTGHTNVNIEANEEILIRNFAK